MICINKIFFILLLLPPFFLQAGIVPCKNLAEPHFKLGVENTHDGIWQWLKAKNKTVGLITNQTGKDQEGKRTIDLLLENEINLKKIFVPEHGLHGHIPAELEVHDSKDAHTDIEVVSLYGKGTGKRVDGHKLHNIDVLVFDMQDCGMRHYTYISTLLYALEAAAVHDKQFVVLDRPNQLGGQMEGPIAQPSSSFIAVAQIPLRYGITIGELAHYYNNHLLSKKAHLHVVQMKNYQRNEKTKLATALSPNIQNQQACYGYSFLGMLGEVRPIDIGLGGPKAMQCFALPEKISLKDAQWQQLVQLLKGKGIHTVAYNYYSTRKKQNYKGLQLKIENISNASSFQALLTVLSYLHKVGVPLEFSQYFDTAVGTKKVREFVTGQLPREQFADQINSDLDQFIQKAAKCFLYKPHPNVIKI